MPDLPEFLPCVVCGADAPLREIFRLCNKHYAEAIGPVKLDPSTVAEIEAAKIELASPASTEDLIEQTRKYSGLSPILWALFSHVRMMHNSFPIPTRLGDGTIPNTEQWEQAKDSLFETVHFAACAGSFTLLGEILDVVMPLLHHVATVSEGSIKDDVTRAIMRI